MGTFDEDTHSYNKPSFVVHRISAAAPASPPPESYKRRDPAGFALKKAAYHLKLGRHFGVGGAAAAFPCQGAEDLA